MSKLAIETQDLTKIFDKKEVVKRVSLRVNYGSVFGFLGANGSGKTTVIRMICGLLTPTAGTGYCLGYDIKTQSTEIKRKIGYMPQKFSLYTRLTVRENLKFFADIYQITNPNKAIELILQDLELTPFINTKANQLSGGWQQRLALACCLVHKPKLLFLDEPTAGIDPKARKELWNYLHKIAVRDGTTVLVTTHYMDEAEKCNDLAYISLGKLLYSGTTRDLIPFSKVKTYLIEVDRALINTISVQIAQSYPDLLVSVVNNELRVSSADEKRIKAFIKEQKKYAFKEVMPSFEEVFIGLIK